MSPPVLTSIGTVLIDRFRWYDEQGNSIADAVDQLGGGSLYAIIGARMWLQPNNLRMMIRSETGLTEELAELSQFGEEVWCFVPGAPTPRTLIEYRGKVRSFKYTQPPVEINPTDFVGTPIMRAEYVHLVASPSRVLSIVEQFESLSWYPKIVWEPHPMWCNSKELGNLRRAMAKVHVLSPNHEEIADFFNEGTASHGQELTTLQVEAIARGLLQDGIGSNGQGSIVIRCGSKGSCSGRRNGELKWLPPYWRDQDQGSVVDTTGAGNAFLGGLVAGLHLQRDDIHAAVPYASISASLVIQQFGLPGFEIERDGGELWNGEDPKVRLKEYIERVS